MVDELRKEIAIQQKKGLPFIMASVIIWLLIVLVSILNQMIYLLIVMWVFSAVPEKMIMVYAMVFGAHLLPYSWLYKSKAYRVFAIIIPVLSLVLGNLFGGFVVAGTAAAVEIAFVFILRNELNGI